MAKKHTEWKLEDIIAWCQANNQVEWLKTTAKKTVKRPVYPKIENVSATGKKTKKSDKTQEPIGYEVAPISFVELKSEFLATFFEKEAKAKKPSMYDLIANL